MTKGKLQLINSRNKSSRCRYSGTPLSRAKALILLTLSSGVLILAAHRKRGRDPSDAEEKERVHTAIWLEPLTTFNLISS